MREAADRERGSGRPRGRAAANLVRAGRSLAATAAAFGVNSVVY